MSSKRIQDGHLILELFDYLNAFPTHLLLIRFYLLSNAADIHHVLTG
jgi:hypothetical protein